MIRRIVKKCVSWDLWLFPSPAVEWGMVGIFLLHEVLYGWRGGGDFFPILEGGGSSTSRNWKEGATGNDATNTRGKTKETYVYKLYIQVMKDMKVRP
jgi:hypothetical protein